MFSRDVQVNVWIRVMQPMCCKSVLTNNCEYHLFFVSCVQYVISGQYNMHMQLLLSES